MRSTIGGNTELTRRIAFTLGALVVYRLGTYIPLPGIDPRLLAEIFRREHGGLLDVMDMSSGGALGRMSLFALSIGPYLSASFAILILTFFSARLRDFIGGGRLLPCTRWVAVVFAAMQAYGLAALLEQWLGSIGSPALHTGWSFRLTTTVTLTGGSTLLVWLAEQITRRGIGNGLSLILFTGLVAHLPRAFAGLLELGRTGALSASVIDMFLVGAVAVVAIVVFMESGQRRIAVEYAARQVGVTMFADGASDLRFKLNSAGIVPAIFASWLVLFPLSIANEFLPRNDIFAEVTVWLVPGSLGHIIVYSVAIIIACLVYTALLLSPRQLSQSLERFGGAIPDVAPGQDTTDYLDGVLTRITLLGGLYLAAICVLPEILISRFALPFYFGGSSVLIVVCVALDTLDQACPYLRLRG